MTNIEYLALGIAITKIIHLPLDVILIKLLNRNKYD